MLSVKAYRKRKGRKPAARANEIRPAVAVGCSITFTFTITGTEFGNSA